MSNDEKFHEYDGIIEHDNPLPTWWLWGFLITVMFAFLYFLHYEVAGGPTLEDELKVSMAQIEKIKAASASVVVDETEESLAKEFGNPDVVHLGAVTFKEKCAACHGQELQGSIGPNLTDKFWLHGHGTRKDILKVVREGVADKGMPPWGPVLKKEEAYAVVAYILSKKGGSPVGAKAPQGDPVDTYLEGQ